MASGIDVENSIAQERFVYKETVLQMLGRLFYCLTALRNYFICQKILKKVYPDAQTLNNP